ncbi:hypothetical protein HOA92_07480 [archaeon]|jgi:hypothetical protein|nr:hypothetical protein [archaeon]MBT6762855.1 hypothetical protein [archaeon]MBT7332299.1 hypothetical protein [Candidatus Woesearchaeota archaeon]
MHREPLYYIAPVDSLDSILKKGILTPKEVQRLIAEKELPAEVLGVSYGGLDSSNFPDYVSMISSFSFAKAVAEQICFAKTGRYNDFNFTAIGYRIRAEIRDLPGFKNEDQVKEMSQEPYPSEVLFEGNIPPEYILKRRFNVRTYSY